MSTLAMNLDNKKYGVIWASTLNLGDDIQTLAAIHLLQENNIVDYTFIDRERLKSYKGELVHLVMNGWFMHDKSQFPPSNKIIPIFISFHCADPKLVKLHAKYFKKWAPIGCRDVSTLNLMKKYDIPAYFSGCLTLAFNECNVTSDKNYIVDINSKDSYIPNIRADISNYTDFQTINHTTKLNKFNRDGKLSAAEGLLNKYRSANLVVTSRIHCAMPCRAFNTDVLFIYHNYNTDKRFSGIKSYLNGQSGWDEIDESKKAIDRSDINNIRHRIKDMFTHIIQHETTDYKFLMGR